MSGQFIRNGVLALSFAATSTLAAPDDWAFSRHWIGKYPSATMDGFHGALLEQPTLKRALGQLVPKPELERLSALKVESLVHEMAGYVVVNLCRPHDCPDDLAMVVIDPLQRRLWAGFFTREGHRSSTRWYTSDDDYTKLPRPVLEEFRDRHGD